MGHVLPLIEEYALRLAASPAHQRLGTPTLSVGRIEGGVSVNTVPDECVIEIDRRLLPGEDPVAAWAHFRDHLTATAAVPVTCDPVWMACPALDPTRPATTVLLVARVWPSLGKSMKRWGGSESWRIGSGCGMPEVSLHDTAWQENFALRVFYFALAKIPTFIILFVYAEKPHF